MSQDLLKETNHLVAGCDRCGACLPVCPLFRLEGLERVSARGKNALARGLAEGGLQPGPELRAAVEFCLLCRACTDACPNHVPTDEAMVGIRQLLTDAAGGPTRKYVLVGRVLRSRALVGLGALALGTLRRLKLMSLVPASLVPREFPQNAFLSAFAGPAALGGHAPASAAPLRAGARVAYFQGCGMRLMFPDAARSTLGLLNVISGVQAKDNFCCGLPHLAHGMGGDFLRLARQNIALYEDSDIVVTDCASCGGALKRLASHFQDDPQWRDRAAAFSAKVMDLTEYLVKAGYRAAARRDVTFTFHDPCHLARGQGIRSAPRQLLEGAGTFVEMDEPDSCCGGAGTFHLDHPEAAARILERKRQNIERTGAGIVVTACPGCLIQLTRAARESGGRFQAMHISQVL
ncbi:MAG: (Fe-S)-binding protein [Holophaga sp.]|nr:(Fe-S)-binding protein [Holophaga sp.]